MGKEVERVAVACGMVLPKLWALARKSREWQEGGRRGCVASEKGMRGIESRQFSEK